MGGSSPTQNDISALVDPQVLANQNYDGTSDINSDSFDTAPTGSTSQFHSYVFTVDTRNGSNGDTVEFVVQERASGGSWSDLTDKAGNTIKTTLNDASGQAELEVSNQGTKQELRVQSAQSANTVGSTIDVAIHLTAGGNKENAV